MLTEMEGIIPALESSHALAYAAKLAKDMDKDDIIVVNLSGRGDKDVNQMKDQVSEAKAQVFLMRYFDDKAPEANVPDPYYGGAEGFEEVYQLLDKATDVFIESLNE